MQNRRHHLGLPSPRNLLQTSPVHSHVKLVKLASQRRKHHFLQKSKLMFARGKIPLNKTSAPPPNQPL